MPRGGKRNGAGRPVGTTGTHPGTNKKYAQAVEKVSVTIDRVIQEYGHIAFLDIREAFTENGDLKSIQDLPDQIARSIAGIEFEEVFEMEGSGSERRRVHVGRIHKIKITNKLGALDSLAKHLGMFIEKHRLVDEEGKDRTIDPFESITRELSRIAERS